MRISFPHDCCSPETTGIFFIQNTVITPLTWTQVFAINHTYREDSYPYECEYSSLSIILFSITAEKRVLNDMWKFYSQYPYIFARETPKWRLKVQKRENFGLNTSSYQQRNYPKNKLISLSFFSDWFSRKFQLLFHPQNSANVNLVN